MASVFTLKALGLNTQPNQLEVPEGSLTIAKNINITRDDVIESRRGFKIYGNSFGGSGDIAKQLISYKLRILRHFDNTLQFDNGSGTFSSFDATVTEAQVGLRTKSIESNGNLYFTSSSGIRKISAKTAADFTTSANFVTNAGAVKGIDISAMLNYKYGDHTDFLTQDSAVAYRVVWGYKDLNTNLLLGTPSQRIEVFNPLLTLLIQDYNILLCALNDIGILGALIDDQNYMDVLGLQINASASDLHDNLIALAAKIDNDILYADNVASAPLQIASTTISSGICTVTFSSGNPTLYVLSGSNIFLSGFSPGTSGVLNGAQVVSSVTSSTITFNTTAVGTVTLTTPTIVSNDFRTIPQPAAPDTPATDQELVNMQTYITNIITQLIAEPNAVIPTAVKAAYIDILDVTTASTVTLHITIPQGITPSYFFQIYRSAVFQATGVQVLSTDVFPNDELQLVYEAFPTAAELAAGTITVEDIVPDNFRGANLYTNPSSGEGILQANDVPPFAKDINVFKNSVFYANTHTRQIESLSLLGVQNMITDYNNGLTPSITISTTSEFNTYFFIVGKVEIFTIGCVAGSALAASGPGSYFDAYSGNDERSYRFWYKIGTAVAPASGGHILVPIVATAADSSTTIAKHTRDEMNCIPADFHATNVTNTVTVTCVTEGYTTDAVDGTSGNTITVTQQGQGENASLNQVLLSDSISPGIAVQETALSLTRVINHNASEVIYSYYTSGSQEVPGQMIWEARDLDTGQFAIITNDINTGSSFSPAFSPTLQISSITVGSPSTMTVVTSTPHGLTNLDFVYISGTDSTPSIDGYRQITFIDATTFSVDATITVPGTKGGVIPATLAKLSSNQQSPNRLYYSKFQQPEAVPVLNYFELGAKDKAILRIFPLRDSLFILKEDGLYRISGEAIPFNLALFDASCILVAPDSVSTTNNVIYGWTRQGISSITESGVRNVSRPIDVDLLPLASSSYTHFASSTWGVGYESDKSYTVFTIKKPSDTQAVQGYKYNTLTNTWTNIDKDYVCGVINFIDDRMYVGPGDINFIEQERKNYVREDFADREYVKNIQGTYITDVLNIDSTTNIQVDDVFVQEQTVTIYGYNMLLKKLDFDIGNSNFFTSLQSVTSDNMRTKLVALAQKLDISGLQFTNYAASIADITGAITAASVGSPVTITSAAHGLVNNRKILISGSNSVPSINGTYTVTVTDANHFTIVPSATVTTAGTAGTFVTESQDFADLQASYNEIISKLNADSVINFANYQPITGTTSFEAAITSVDPIAKRIALTPNIQYIQGSFTVFSAIDCQVVYSPNTFGGDPVSLKHMREAQILFSDLAFTKATISFATDLLPLFQPVDVFGDGNGIFGFTPFGQGFFGGASNSAPIRTYIPRDCQRCRFMIVKFNHRTAREKWSLFGITLTGETQLSARAYR